jgi:sec-independent protein translocase protein TatB
MLDIGWQELFIVAVLVIIVIGPKDLPRAMRTVAAWVRKARSLAREFQGGLDDMMNEADLDDVKKQIESTKNFDFGEDIESALDPDGDFADDLDMTEIEADLDAAARTEAPKSNSTESNSTESNSTKSKPTESKPTESKPTERNSTKSEPAEGDAPTTDDEEETKTASKAGG